MADVSFNIIASAGRFRAANESLRARDQVRANTQELTARRASEIAQRGEAAEAEARRKAQSLRSRRDDNETDQARALFRGGQRQVLDAIDSDAQFRRLRDNVTSELNLARRDEATANSLLDSEAEEALALDGGERLPAGSTAEDPREFQAFLSDRADRLDARQQQARDFSVQQRIDLQISDNNLSTSHPGETQPRGSIIDVSG